MNRKDELLRYLCKTEDEKLTIGFLLDEFLFLERKLTELKKLPFIKTHPSNPNLQKATPAAKQYKELLQQYTNIIKILEKTGGDEQEGRDSPLRIWVKQNAHTA